MCKALEVTLPTEASSIHFSDSTTLRVDHDFLASDQVEECEGLFYMDPVEETTPHRHNNEDNRLYLWGVSRSGFPQEIFSPHFVAVQSDLREGDNVVLQALHCIDGQDPIHISIPSKILAITY